MVSRNSNKSVAKPVVKKATAKRVAASKPTAPVVKITSLPTTMTLSKPATLKRIHITAREHVAMVFVINPNAKKGENNELWTLSKIVCEWFNKQHKLVGYFVKYKGYEHLDE